MKINQNWKIQSFNIGEEQDLVIASPDYIDHYWIPAKVPGDIHSTLIQKGIIENPYFGFSDQKCRWVEEKVWWYRTEFQFQDTIQKNERIELIFEGLDTFATVYLNGVELGSTENMFISHTFDVTREIQLGKNTLAVKFDPISEHVKNKQQNFWSGFSKERVWTRKAQMNYGWDWGPRIVTAGIWRDVRLEKRKIAKIDSVFAKTTQIEPSHATIEIEVSTVSYDRSLPIDIEVNLSKDGQDFVCKATAITTVPTQTTFLTLDVPDPKLWWTHDLGSPDLYQLKTTLFQGDRILDERVEEFGIRTIEVLQKDENGNSVFTFVLNGIQVFAKGADWIPVDQLIGAAPDSRYSELIRLAREANMNMLRVWGGGIYEKEIFYQECNRQGILVWQDFMFACALYPDFNRNFMNNVREEIIQVVKRLRNHPCLALWCGNNENDWLYEVLYSAGDITMPFYGEKIYHELMPELVSQLDPTRLYWPSSPYGGNDHNSPLEGDSHNWQVWHGNVEPRKFGEVLGVNYSVEGVSFKNYKRDMSTFVSEFGMHASANRYTLQRYLPEGTFYWGSDEMAYRNKDYHHPKGILLMEGYTGIPKNIDEYITYSMLTQAEGLKYGVEHYRRRKPLNSGALIWQLNDSWPGTSWSMIDYHLLPKASYYYAKKFFHPILLSLEHEPGEQLNVWVVNDEIQPYTDSLQIEVQDFYGNAVFSKVLEVEIPANGSALVLSVNEEDVLKGVSANQVFVHLSSLQGKTVDKVYYLRDQKDLVFPTAHLQVEIDGEKDEIQITTDTIARFITLEIPQEKTIFSDNFFDLPPKSSIVISVSHLEGAKVDLSNLRVTAWNDCNLGGESV